MRYFANPSNPQPDEVRAWAYDPEAEPAQDFDLILSWVRHERAYLALASDPRCPRRWYFLHVLYLTVGDAVRGGFKSVAKPVLRGFVERGSEFDHPDIRAWQQRSHELVDAPDLFDFDLWCAGGFASGADT